MEQQLLDGIEISVWKSINGIEGKLKVQKGTGRAFADTVVGRLYFSEKIDFNKTIYVAKGTHGAYWGYNQSTKTVAEI